MAERLLPRVKLCGITNLEDLRLAVECGVDAIGLVLHEPSPRWVPVPAAIRLVANIPASVLPVAVLVEVDPERARLLAKRCGARAVQLCGAALPGDWVGFPLPILRRVGVQEGALEELQAWQGIARGFVLDHPDTPGGSGRPVDPHRAASLAAAAPCLLAGGLGPDNVAAAVAAVCPAGVDASSRLEIAPGRKDPVRVRAFVHAARKALDEVSP